MGEFTMPALGSDMTVGRLVEWMVEPGDTVTRGDVIAVVETDKAAIEVEVWETGTVAELLVSEGTRVPVGTPLALIGADTAAERPATAPAPAAAPEPQPVPVPESVPAAAATPRPVVRGPLARRRAEALQLDLTKIRGSGPGGVILRHDVEDAATAPRPRVSPYARRRAREAGIDPTGLDGTGPGSAVVARDVERASSAAAPSVERPRSPAEAMRAAVARATARSKREIPHYYLGTTVDVTDTMAWLEEHNAERAPNERVLLAAVQLHAVAGALAAHAEFNGHWLDDGFVPSDRIDVCVAVALRDGGLVAPAITAADRLDVDGTMAALRDLVRRARSGRLRGSEMAGGSITVTNLGELGVDTVHGVILPPQVAIVGFGRPRERPWVVDGELAVRNTLNVTVAADHRQTDGMTGGRFLRTITDLLLPREEP